MEPYYTDESVEIYHADWREVLPARDPGSAHIAVTSPPYNLIRNWIGGGPHSTMDSIRDKILNGWYEDSVPEPEYQADQAELLTELTRVCAGSVFYNHKIRYAIKRAGRAIHPMEWVAAFPVWSEIIWDRVGALPGKVNRVFHADERIYQIKRPHTWHNQGYTSVWRIHAAAQGFDHPCPFPVEIPKRCIAMASDAGDVVIDPYMGSGTTLRAAKDLGRRAIGIEIEERYCEIAARRMSQLALV